MHFYITLLNRIAGRRRLPFSRNPSVKRFPQDVFCSTKFKILNKTILARWPAARPRCIPPAIGSYRALSPFQSQKNVSPFNPSQGDFALPAPIDLAGVPAPKTPDNAVEAISWRPTLRGLDAAILPKMNHSQGPIATPKTQLVGLGKLPLHRHRTMHNQPLD